MSKVIIGLLTDAAKIVQRAAAEITRLHKENEQLQIERDAALRRVKEAEDLMRRAAEQTNVRPFRPCPN